MAVLALGMSAAGIALWLTQSPQPDPVWLDAENTVDAPAAGARSAPGDESRPNYRYSIVEGGVHTGNEMRQAIERDSVVAAHYAGLDPSRFRVERLPVRTEAHVSYRIGREVFWTRKKLVLEAGEPILSDGTNIIRARCGNRVSMEVFGPEGHHEPPQEEFEQTSEPAVDPAEPPTDFSDPGILVARQLRSLPFGGPTGAPTAGSTYGPMVFGAGSGSGSSQSIQAPPLDERLASDSDPDSTADPNPIQGPGPEPVLEPRADPSLHPEPGLSSQPDPGPYPGPGLYQDPDSTLGLTRTPEPTPEPSTMVLTGLGAAGWYLARVRRRARAWRASSDHARR